MRNSINQTVRVTTLGICLTFASHSLSAQASMVVGPDVLVSDDNSGPHYEPTIAADLSDKNSKVLLGAAFVVLDGGNRMAPKLYRSEDGGSTWVDSIVPEGQKMENAANFQVAFDRHGIAYYLGIMIQFRAMKEADRKPGGDYFYRSNDKGETWLPGVRFDIDDHPQLVVDTTTGPYADRIYISTENGLYRSENGGRSFIGPVSPPHREPHFSGSNSLNPLILSNGCLFLPRQEWSEGPQVDEAERQVLGVFSAISCDGGVSFSKTNHVQDQVLPGNHRFLDELRNGSIVGLSIPALAVDSASQQYRDRLYMVWTDARFGNQRVFFTLSKDRGEHWTDPVQIDSKVPPESSQYKPSIAVNQDGIIGIQWFDTRDSSDQNSYNLYFTSSKDGGASFDVPVRVSTAPSYPHGAGNIERRRGESSC